MYQHLLLMIPEPEEIANGVSILPLLCLLHYAKITLQSVTMTSMCVSSLIYHVMYGVNKQNIGNKFFVLDCSFQIISFIVVFIYSSCYHLARVLPLSIACCQLAGVFYYSAYFDKKMILNITLSAHLSNAVFTGLYSSDKCSYILGMATFLIISVLFVSSLYFRFCWCVGHLFLLPGIFYLWKSVDMIHETKVLEISSSRAETYMPLMRT
jgi:hypothetical protein